jgi:Protein of unknown function (DUF998)
VVFLATTLYGAAITGGYDQVRDAVSALSQRGAPHAGVVNALFLLAAVLQVALGFGVRQRFRGQDRAMVRAGGLIAIYAAMGALIAAFFPMDPMGGAVTVPGILHLVLVGLSALVLIAAMVLGRRLPGVVWFSRFTWICLAGMLLGAAVSALAGVMGWQVLGLGERLTQDSYLVWLFVLGLRAAPPRDPLPLAAALVHSWASLRDRESKK